MTCKQAVDILDAGPFVARTRAAREQALMHARECPACSLALFAAKRVADGLSSLAQPMPMQDLTGVVLGRIADLELTAAPVDSVAPAAARTHPAAPGFLWAQLASSVALVAGIALLLLGVGLPAAFQVVVARDADVWGGLNQARVTASTALGLLAGLVFYALGLFAPLVRSPRQGAR